MATCIDCAIEKPASDFYTHPQAASGHMGVCKVCHKLRMKRRRLLDPAVQAAEVARAKKPHRKAVSRVISGMWRDKNPVGYKAQTAVGNALRDRHLKKEPCAICGGLKVRGFHRDYSKPLEVVWLCAKCHCRLLASFPEIRALAGPDQKTGRTAQATPEGVPCGGVSRQDQVADAVHFVKYALDHALAGGRVVAAVDVGHLRTVLDRVATPSQPVPAVAVKGLVWASRPNSKDQFADTPCGRYAVGIVHGSYIATIRLIKDGQWDDEVFARGLCTRKEAKAAAQADYEARISSALAPATQAVPDIVRPVCRVMTMQHSSGAPDHYVSIEVGDRQITPHMFKTKGRAEYEVAEWIWLLNGGEKPSVLDFDTDPQPLCGASHPASSESQSPAGAKIRSTQGNAMEAAPVTGQSPVGAVSPCVSAPEKGTRLDGTWNYRIPETLADLILLFETRVACHRLWAEWLDQDTDETRRYSEHGIGPAKAHWDYVKQYSAAKQLVEEHERGAVTDAMIEAVAIGICKLHCFDPDRPTSRSGLRLKWMDYTEQAREALAAALGAGTIRGSV
ncbi:hypothetical protein [Mesorhizobium sp.]|uniref:hypothetical protein n=1 Tax=Mesorhizobium sp. TaxID=1871066 RepID=UPI001228B184|nr:hypothetical protein [Mesorhizobium sp.]TIN76719.1 MAG: hypothetical protein E5Y09_20725 [Mesorhizobium sp.]